MLLYDSLLEDPVLISALDGDFRKLPSCLPTLRKMLFEQP